MILLRAVKYLLTNGTFKSYQNIQSSDTEMLLRAAKVFRKKVQGGKDHEKAQSEKDSHSKNRGGKKLQVGKDQEKAQSEKV